MTDIFKKAKGFLTDYRPGHSNFQIDNFIVGNVGDTWAQYNQALRELNSRHDILKSLAPKIKAAKFNGTNKAMYSADVKRAKIVLREYKRLIHLASELKEKIGEITKEKRDELERKSWRNKALKSAAIERFLTGTVSKNTFEFILALPTDDQNVIIKKVFEEHDHKKLLSTARGEKRLKELE